MLLFPLPLHNIIINTAVEHLNCANKILKQAKLQNEIQTDNAQMQQTNTQNGPYPPEQREGMLLNRMRAQGARGWGRKWTSQPDSVYDLN